MHQKCLLCLHEKQNILLKKNPKFYPNAVMGTNTYSQISTNTQNHHTISIPLPLLKFLHAPSGIIPQHTRCTVRITFELLKNYPTYNKY